eukprot:5159844-Pyramimonas_sp.AAC.1
MSAASYVRVISSICSTCARASPCPPWVDASIERGDFEKVIEAKNEYFEKRTTEKDLGNWFIDVAKPIYCIYGCVWSAGK